MLLSAPITLRVTLGVMLAALVVCVTPSQSQAKGPRTKASATSKKDPGPVYKVPVDNARDAFKGNPNALVTWVIFCDLSDVFCARYRQSIGKAREYFGADLRVVYKHFPLSYHYRAHRASEATLCAGEHDMFWEMHDHLAQNRSAHQGHRMMAHARAAGLAGERLVAFEQCFTSRKYDPHVLIDKALANAVGARAIPYSYINGRMLRGAVSYKVVRSLIDRELTAAKRLAKARKLADKDVYNTIIADGVLGTRLADKVVKFPKRLPTAGKAKRPKHVVTTFVDMGSLHSRRVLKTLLDYQAKLPEEITVRALHYPMSASQRTKTLHLAAACADRQKRFFAFVDETGRTGFSAPSERTLRGIATRAKVADPDKLLACLKKAAASKKPSQVDRHRALGKKYGATSGSIFLNGRRFGGKAHELGQVVGLVKPPPKTAEILTKKATACHADATSCDLYARALIQYGPPQRRFHQAAAAYDRACKADNWGACSVMAEIVRNGDGVPFDEARYRALKARTCKLSKGKRGCPRKLRKVPYDQRRDFFNTGPAKVMVPMRPPPPPMRLPPPLRALDS